MKEIARTIVPGRVVPALVLVLLIAVAGCGDVVVAPVVGVDDDDDLVSEVSASSYAVDPGVVLSVETFTGSVMYRVGETGTVHVEVTRRAPRRSDLEHLAVDTVTGARTLSITATNADDVRRAQVDILITAPADAIPRLSSAVGPVNYAGRPQGNCGFTVGVGTVWLRLPADADVTVELSAAVGKISLGIPVSGTVRDGYVAGRIGNGGEGTIQASTAVGNIRVERR